jgi:hypothetical protein
MLSLLRKEMRAKGDALPKGDKSAKIVRRELAQVFTNGTIVDGTYLTSDEANHCVAIKVCQRPHGGPDPPGPIRCIPSLTPCRSSQLVLARRLRSAFAS